MDRGGCNWFRYVHKQKGPTAGATIETWGKNQNLMKRTNEIKALFSKRYLQELICWFRDEVPWFYVTLAMEVEGVCDDEERTIPSTSECMSEWDNLDNGTSLVVKRRSVSVRILRCIKPFGMFVVLRCTEQELAGEGWMKCSDWLCCGINGRGSRYKVWREFGWGKVVCLDQPWGVYEMCGIGRRNWTIRIRQWCWNCREPHEEIRRN